ncbi:MaoC/PaaZ C-terminal domain-containing protein [Salinigranum salinum]|uniref:MaoC/PaaZ C-terminal domain-containing protein n=1 Tax=Salinigranum salinum TaxID=1364937 RepID=UPI00126066C2|nr:MaoC/PaaZ C-terminal domain-containing protein [Salinigranum salinum]
MSDDRYYEEVDVGEQWQTDGRTVTEADVVNYAGVSGDFHPYHVDAEFAGASEFGSRIAHGLLVLSIAAALESTENEHAFMYGFESMRFVNPTMLGDTIHVEVEVTDKSVKSDAYGVVTKHFDVRNQDDETVLACDKLELFERSDAA